MAAPTALACVVFLAGCGPKAAQAPGAPEVTVAYPLAQQVVDWDDYVGRFEAAESVELKPRVSGQLQAAHFQDGQTVRKGQLLFSIDPRPAQAVLDQAKAQLARAEATLANARQEEARAETLLKSQAVSQQVFESRQAAARSAAADVAAAQASVRAQALQLSFTRVTAPISGRVSQRMVDPGNAVTADTTVLTTIVSTSPIHFAFEGSEALLLKYQRENGGQKGAAVMIRLQDEADYTHEGRLDFVDNALNNGAGTIAGRAVVANANGFLKPGMFGHMRLRGAAPYGALLIPDSAVMTDGARKLVMIAGEKDIVTAKPVQLGPVLGGMRVIRSGLTATDRVIVNGLLRGRPGSPVAPKMTTLTVAPKAADDQPTVMAPQASSASAAN